MDRKTGVAATLVLVSGLFYRIGAPASQSARNRAPAPAESASESTPSLASSESGPWTPVCNHFQLTGSSEPINPASPSLTPAAKPQRKFPNGPSGPKPSWDDEKARTLDRFCIDPLHAFTRRTVLIATVPDPELTHLALKFDRFIQSIAWAAADGDGGYAKEAAEKNQQNIDANNQQSAAETQPTPPVIDQRYSFDAYWFPWRPATTQETDPEKRATQEQNRQKRLNTPGLLLFHGTADPNQLLFVFLVGETPTSGINRVAFRQAWKYAAALKTDSLPVCPAAPASAAGPSSGAQSPNPCIGILGPSFSGSVAPFLTLLDDLQNESAETGPPSPGQIFLISGSTTSPPAISRSSLYFCTAVESDKAALNALRQYLAAADLPLERQSSAVLVEAETGYGSEISKEISKDPQSESLVLRYPRGISTLRNSSEELPEISNAAPQPNEQYPELPLNLRDTGKDAIPALSNVQSPVSQEAVLLEIASTIKRESISQVAILATDPIDALFLARFIRSAAPNTGVTVVGSDLLYALAAQKWNLEGTLALTSYPLLSRNQYFARTHNPRRTQFASADAEGEYNACRRMLLPALQNPANTNSLCDSDLAQDPDENKRQDYLLDYASPFAEHLSGAAHSHKPPVWLTILGREAWWPVAAFDPARASGSPQLSTLFQGPQPSAHNHERFTVEAAPPVWFIFFWVTLLACAAHVFVVLRMNVGDHGMLWRSPRLRVLASSCQIQIHASPEALKEIKRRRFYLAWTALVVGVAAALLVSTMVASELDKKATLEFVCALIVSLTALLEAAWIASGARHGWLIYAAGAAALFAVGWIGTGPDSGNARQFAGYRSVHVESGTSPLLPAILSLLAVYLFLWFRLQQLRRQEDGSPSLPGSHFLHLSADAHHVEHLLPPQKHFIIGGAVVTTLLWLFLFNPFSALFTLERPAYRLLIVSLVSLLIYLIAWSVFRFLLAWKQQRTLLNALERHPVRYAFSRLPKDFSWTSIWTGDPRPSFESQARSLDVLRTLTPNLGCLKHLTENLDKLTSPGRDYKDPDLPGKVEAALNDAAESLAAAQKPIWDRGVSESIASREDKDKVPDDWQKEPDSVAREEFLALRYVSFIRFALRQMRSTFEFLSVGFILLVLALNIYPYQGHHKIGILLIVAFILLAGSVLTVFAQMDRDPVLSRLSDSKPNELDRNFIWRAISFTALPLLTLLASLVPQLGSFLSSWIQPTLQALK